MSRILRINDPSPIWTFWYQNWPSLPKLNPSEKVNLHNRGACFTSQRMHLCFTSATIRYYLIVNVHQHFGNPQVNFATSVSTEIGLHIPRRSPIRGCWCGASSRSVGGDCLSLQILSGVGPAPLIKDTGGDQTVPHIQLYCYKLCVHFTERLKYKVTTYNPRSHGYQRNNRSLRGRGSLASSVVLTNMNTTPKTVVIEFGRDFDSDRYSV